MEAPVQLARLASTFGLGVSGERVRWTSECRFELVVFSVEPLGGGPPAPFTFRHQEREGAHGTFLGASGFELHLRSWDFVSGEAFRSERPIVFSFSSNPLNKRDFMNLSGRDEPERFVHFDDSVHFMYIGATL